MGKIKNFFKDKGRLGVVIVCLLMLALVIISNITGETMAASTMCLQCNNNSNVVKVGTSINPDDKCSVTYKEVDFSVCENLGLESPKRSLIVNFKLNGGDSLSGSSTKSCEYISTTSSSCSVTDLPTATRTGYNFKGWGVSSSCTAGVTDKITLYASTENYTTNYYACWTKKTYTIKYDANGGSGAPETQYKEYGETITLSTTKPTRSNYAFLGWNTNPETNTVKYKAGAEISTNANVTLYAVWEENNKQCFSCRTDKNLLKWKVSNSADSNCSAGYDKVAVAEDYCQSYLVKYDANGGTGAPSSQYKAHSVNLTLTSVEPTRNGYDFKGWNTKANGTGTSYAAGASYDKNSAIVLYAKWKEIITDDGGDSPDTHKVNIKYKTNGGTVASTTDAGTWTVVDSLINLNSNVLQTTINYGNKLGVNGLIDYYSGANLRVTKTGYDAVKSAEWICLEGCITPNKTFDQVTAYSHSDFCNASNEDCTVILGVNWTTSKVNIKYNPNGGIVATSTADGNKKWAVSNDVIYLNNALHVTTVNYGSKLGTNGLTDYNSLANLYITKTGHKAKNAAEWICLYGDCETGKTFSQSETYNHSDFCDASNGDCTVVLGVNWTLNKVHIKYNTNGGTIKNINGYSSKDDLIYEENEVFMSTIDYGKTTSENGISNYNNSTYMYITKEGSSVPVDEEWICISGGCTTGKTFSQSKKYNHNDFCDASNGDCTVVLGVNWQNDKYTVKYNANGGTGTMNDSIYTYGIAKSLNANNFVRDGYTFKYWNTKADGTGINYANGQSISIVENMTLYAQWKSNTTTDEEEEIKKFYVEYNANGGTGTMEKSSHKYGFASNLSLNKFNREGYIFNGWNTKNDGTGDSYTDGQTISDFILYDEDSIILYAMWKIAEENGGDNEKEEIGPGNDGTTGGDNNDDIDKSPQTGSLATILVSLIGLGSLYGFIYYRKKVKI